MPAFDHPPPEENELLIGLGIDPNRTFFTAEEEAAVILAAAYTDALIERLKNQEPR